MAGMRSKGVELLNYVSSCFTIGDEQPGFVHGDFSSIDKRERDAWKSEVVYGLELPRHSEQRNPKSK
ncbi:unnamed protein product [Sphenostylis stenocarpa]|uniref:Uncharacterized protein n=1 Tax=Sphenostylis stenocarpa TaxID=92480 RepID=A0AA86S8F7_9FABA|nr:unnamed protein product [Sphenostylis stenocarpa]